MSLEQRVRAYRRSARTQFYRQQESFGNPVWLTNWRMIIARKFRIPISEVRRILGEKVDYDPHAEPSALEERKLPMHEHEYTTENQSVTTVESQVTKSGPGCCGSFSPGACACRRGCTCNCGGCSC